MLSMAQEQIKLTRKALKTGPESYISGLCLELGINFSFIYFFKTLRDTNLLQIYVCGSTLPWKLCPSLNKATLKIRGYKDLPIFKDLLIYFLQFIYFLLLQENDRDNSSLDNISWKCRLKPTLHRGNIPLPTSLFSKYWEKEVLERRELNLSQKTV